jgi:hypothetical protein
MQTVTQKPVPDFSLLRTYRAPLHANAWKEFMDCFVAELDRTVSLAEFIRAFYDSLPFRLERGIIRALIGRPSTTQDVQALASGAAGHFAAWVVLERTETQLLLGDYRGHTRSWLAVRPLPGGGTQLLFGSGIRSVPDPVTGAPAKTWGFRALGWFHLLYSRVLLGAARRGLAAGSPRQG